MTDRPERSFFASGGWVLLLAVLLVAVVFSFHVANLLGHRSRAIGDGADPGSYGFALAPSLLPAGSLVAGGVPKDGIPALVDPPVSSAAELAEAAARSRRGKYLVDSDRVIGVEIAGAARAYPLRLLVWHEVANDVLGGRAIAVTYNPLCDSAVVFDRRVGGETLTFGVSGLLFNSNLLMYDRRATAAAESLWSQLLLRAVTGPAAAAGTRLEALPCALTTWGEWRVARLDTTVVVPEPGKGSKYKREPYVSYFGSDSLRFPVALPPDEEGRTRKEPVVVLADGAGWLAVPHRAVERAPGRRLSLTASGRPVTLTYRDHPPRVDVTADGGVPPLAIYTFRFAWRAVHPDDTTWLD
jgi:hypothetical protein